MFTIFMMLRNLVCRESNFFLIELEEKTFVGSKVSNINQLTKIILAASSPRPLKKLLLWEWGGVQGRHVPCEMTIQVF